MNKNSSLNFKIPDIKYFFFYLSITLSIFFFLNIFNFLINNFELSIYDLKFNFRKYINNESSISSDIVVVALDDKSKISSGYEYLWPYDYYAKTIDRINRGNPNIIGVDIFFTNTIDTAGWSNLINKYSDSFLAINPYIAKLSTNKVPIDVNKNSQVINEINLEKLPFIETLSNNHIEDIIYQPNFELQEVSSGLGFVNIHPDSDGVLRRIPIVAELNNSLVPHFFLKLICEHYSYPMNKIELKNNELILNDFPNSESEKKNLIIPLDSYGNMLINYMSFDKIELQRKKGEFNYISAWSLINNDKDIDFNGKTVIFGDFSSSGKDYSQTPVDTHLYNSLIFSVAMSNIMNDQFILSTSKLISIIQIFFLFIIIYFSAHNFKILHYCLISNINLLLLLILNFYFFIYLNINLNLLEVIIPITIISYVILIYKLYNEQVKIGVLEGSLNSYLSPHLMDKIKNNPDILRLGGERKKITVLFSDIVNFTYFTDKADPIEVQEVLEEYFSEMTSIVFKNNGIVDKYLGDGILAFFENPKDGINSPQSAIKTSIEMMSKAKQLNNKYKNQNKFPFSIYIGIATGFAKVGNIGPPEKVDYTIIGSVVNKAARLDSAGKPGDILIDENTYFFVKDDYSIENYGKHQLKGFEEKINIYKVIGIQ